MKYSVEKIASAYNNGARSINEAIRMAGYPVNGYTAKLGRKAATSANKASETRRNLSQIDPSEVLKTIKETTVDGSVNVVDVLKKLNISVGGDNHRGVAGIVDRLGLFRRTNSRSRKRDVVKNIPSPVLDAVSEYVSALEEWRSSTSRFNAAKMELFKHLGLLDSFREGIGKE